MAYLERSKIVDSSGTVVNPATDEAITQGELINAIEALRMAVHSLTRTIGQVMPDTAGRVRANIEAGTLSTVSTVSTVATVTNQTNVGGFAATEQVPSLMRLGADALRRNIIVS